MKKEEKQTRAELRQNVKSAKNNVLIMDIVLFALVISTMAQLADVLGHGTPNWSDWLKAGSFSLIEFFFARAASRAHLTDTKAWPLWLILVGVMLLIIPLNLIYAWEKSYTGLVSGQYTEDIMSHDLIVNYLAAGGSGIISLLIAGMSFSRLIAEKSITIAEQKLQDFEELTEQRRINRERQRRYRETREESDVDDDYVKQAVKKYQKGYNKKKTTKRGRPRKVQS